MLLVDLKPLVGRLEGYCKESLENAVGLCVSRGHYEITVEHVLLKMLEDPSADLALIMAHFDVDVAAMTRSLQAVLDDLRSGNAGKPVLSPLLIEWIQDAWMIASIDQGQAAIRSGSAR